MTILVILLAIALSVSLAAHFFGPSAAKNPGASTPDKLEAETHARQRAEADLDRKRKELEEQRAQVNELKDALKQAKRKAYEQKEAGKEGQDLAKAREATERQASVQLETTRAELATALSELERLKAEREGGRGRRPTTAAAVEAPVAAPPAEKPVVQRVVRELSEADKERMERLEQQAAKDRARAGELERELRRFKGRAETQARLYTVSQKELELVKDKYKALEKRLNRVLLESDLLRRAIRALEKTSGVNAERTELSAEEMAASDREVEDRQRQEAAAAEAALAAKQAAAAENEPPEQSAQPAS